MFAITRGRLAAAAFGLTAAVAAAQSPITYGPVAGCPLGNCAAANHGTYGPALFAVNPSQDGKKFPLLGPDEPSCVGRSSYPLSDWHYIRQFCGPTLQPGTCHGYHATKWRKWEDTCATAGGAGCGSAMAPAMMAPAPLMIAPPTPVAPVTPSEKLPPPKEEKPKADVPKVDPVTPPKVPLIPKDSGARPAPLPAIPALPVPMPSEPGKINTTENLVPMPTPAAPVVVPVPEPRVVVPPK